MKTNKNNPNPLSLVKLSVSVQSLEAQVGKFKQVYEKLKKENEKLADIRDSMQEQLDVSNITTIANRQSYRVKQCSI